VRPEERGSAVVESVFGIFVLLILVLGTVQVALSLYARNVVMTSVHEGARTVVEIGGSNDDGRLIATRAIERSAGSLIDELNVAVTSTTRSSRVHVNVTARGLLDAPGPVPIKIPVTVHAQATREVLHADDR